LRRKERGSFFSLRAGKYRLCRPNTLVVDKVCCQVDGQWPGGKELLRLESKSCQTGGLIVGQGARAAALGWGEGIGCAIGGKTFAAASNLYGLLNGKGAHQVLHALAVGKGRGREGEQKEKDESYSFRMQNGVTSNAFNRGRQKPFPYRICSRKPRLGEAEPKKSQRSLKCRISDTSGSIAYVVLPLSHLPGPGDRDRPLIQDGHVVGLLLSINMHTCEGIAISSEMIKREIQV
jgi:hypothetical protein